MHSRVGAREASPERRARQTRMVAIVTRAPHNRNMDWDLTAYFPDFDHPDREAYQTSISNALNALTTRAQALPLLGDETSAATAREAWVEVTLELEALGSRLSHYSSYVHALAAADGRRAEYRAAEARLDSVVAQFDGLVAELRRVCGHSSQNAFDMWLADERLRDADYFLRRLREEMQSSMPAEHERLAADLGIDGINAWGRLYDTLTSRLSFEMPEREGQPKRLPLSARRSLMESSERETRRAAFEGGNLAFEPILPTLAAALNHIAGTRLTLNAHRGVAHFLDPALFDGSISHATLSAMYDAVHRKIDLPRDVLRFKADAEGLKQLAWFDVGAPIGGAALPTLDWQQARNLVHDAFDSKYPRLGGFFRNALASRWVDWQPREGKRPGAFCTSSPELGQSRVFMSYGGTLSDVSTLAHEMGHAFHSHVLGEKRWLAKRYPMTLAETASTFAELLLAHGTLGSAATNPTQKQAVRGALVNDAAVFLLDITVRFEFEKAFYERRAEGEIDVERICQLMRETQLRILGDVLDPEQTDPYYWASKLHFFITRRSFYNYPYTFGYLLSRGLFARFEEEGAAFLPRYESFLKRSASERAHVVARDTLGCDLERAEFWEASIDSLKAPLDALRHFDR